VRPLAEPYQVSVEDVFNLTGRGVAVIGVHTGGVINSGDRAVLRSGDTEVPVPELFVEIHHPPGKIALLLRGVERDQVLVGAVLGGP
jgi:translation elongation factor EF-Tu-like GTPase